jgi:hypothetical protein
LLLAAAARRRRLSRRFLRCALTAARSRPRRAPQVVDHYEKPRNVGSFDKKDPNVGTGLVGAPACGDVMKLQIRVRARRRPRDARRRAHRHAPAAAQCVVAPRATCA